MLPTTSRNGATLPAVHTPTVIEALLLLVRGTPLDHGEAWWRQALLRHYLPAEAPAEDWLSAVDRVLAGQGTSVERLRLGEGA